VLCRNCGRRRRGASRFAAAGRRIGGWCKNVVVGVALVTVGARFDGVGPVLVVVLSLVADPCRRCRHALVDPAEQQPLLVAEPQ
jgi:hypothetical protein